MVPDGQKVRTDRMDGWTDDAKTISLQLHRGMTSIVFFLFKRPSQIAVVIWVKATFFLCR